MDISAIICTRNRATTLMQCLTSVIAALNESGAKCELIVVDNGSTDSTSQLVRDYAVSLSDSAQISIRLVQEPLAGLSRARNAGLRAATGEIIAFTDDDCRPQLDYYKRLLALAQPAQPPTLFGGMVILGDHSDQPYGIVLREQAERWQKDTDTTRGRNLAVALIGANMAMHRQLADRIGDFDPRYGAGGKFKSGEEIDYIYRTYLAGLPIRYCPELVVEHFHGRKTLDSIQKLASGYDRGDGALYAKYLFSAPQLLRPLIWDVKKALKELRGGELCRPELHISHWQRLWQVTLGMLDYFIIQR